MSKKASDLVKYYRNENGPVIGTVHKNVICQDGLYFKDIDGTGEISRVNDWRLSSAERAKAYVETLTIEEKIGQLFISDWRMGKYPAPIKPIEGMEPPVPRLDESGILDEAELQIQKVMTAADGSPVMEAFHDEG